MKITRRPSKHKSLRGTKRNDRLRGAKGRNRLFGLAGKDTLTGSSNRDLLDGGRNKDRLVGGRGNDTYVVDQAGDRIVEKAGQGTDTVRSTVSWALPPSLENVTFNRAANINGTGNELNNSLIGNAGNNILSGRGGNDWLSGGGGDDTLQGSDGAIGEIDTLIGGSGSDQFILGITTAALYDDGNAATEGAQDYALVKDFNLNEDILQLNGQQSDYLLAASPTGLPIGTAIYRIKPESEPDELIAILENQSIASFIQGFRFTLATPTPTPINSTPTIDLNGAASGNNFMTSFTEDSGPVAIVDAANLTVNDDSGILSEATIALTNPLDGADELLAVNTGSTNITASYWRGMLRLSGQDTVANYQQVLRSLTYSNRSQTPDASDRVVSITISDGSLTSSAATATIAIQSVNDMPLIASTIADQTANEDNLYQFQFSADTFLDLDGDELTYTATQKGGTALPTWLSFNANTRTFSGTPTQANVGTIAIDLTASDGKGSIRTRFDLTVADTNEAPLANPDTVTAARRTSTTFNLVNNDTDSDGTIDPTKVAIAAAPMSGTLVNNGDSTSARFDTREYMDLTMGLDSILYGLLNDASSEGETVVAFDPSTMNQLWTASLAKDVQSIAINETGDIFGASFDGNIYHFNEDGNQLDSLNPGVGSLTDIDVSFDDKLIASSRADKVVVTDELLDSASLIPLGLGTTYNMLVSFKDYQEPFIISNTAHTVNLAIGQVASNLHFGSIGG